MGLFYKRNNLGEQFRELFVSLAAETQHTLRKLNFLVLWKFEEDFDKVAVNYTIENALAALELSNSGWCLLNLAILGPLLLDQIQIYVLVHLVLQKLEQ